MIRVAVVANSTVARAGLEALVRADARFSVEAAEQRVSCDVVLAEGESAAIPARVQTVAPDAPIVLLAHEPTRAELRSALHAGARAILSHTASAQEILAALEAVAAGLTVFSSEQMDLLIPNHVDSDEPEEWITEPLTPREAQVLALLAEGAGNKEIADRLHVSEHTAKFHVSSILGKLGASSRTEAVTRGLRDGLIVI